MTDYLYNADTALNPSTSKQTFQLLLPSDYVEVTPGKLYSSRIWVIVQIGGKIFLYAKLYPISIESITTDVGEDRLVLNADVMKSTYFLSSSELEINQKYIVPASATNLPSMKLSELSLNESENFGAIENSAQQYLFSTPTPTLPYGMELSEVKLKSNIVSSIRTIVEIAKHNFSVADLARDARNRTCDEYHCLAAQYLLKSEHFDNDDIWKAIGNSQSFLFSDSPERHPTVDTDLHPIDPETIKSRTFVPPENDNSNTMAATEKAEQSHQAMLRDISEYLLARGVTPLESSSIDIAVKQSSGLILFEIKSSNADNFFRQCEKALSQILKYDYEFHKSDIKISGKYLIAERSMGDFEEKSMKDFFNYCDIGVLYYDQSKAWSERLSGIEDILC